MREAAAEAGYSLELHRSQLVTPGMLQWADLVLYMDGGNLKRLQHVRGFSADKCKALGSYLTEPVERISDPNYMARGSTEFNAVVCQLLEACKGFVATC